MFWKIERVQKSLMQQFEDFQGCMLLCKSQYINDINLLPLQKKHCTTPDNLSAHHRELQGMENGKFANWKFLKQCRYGSNTLTCMWCEVGILIGTV